jgi:hypothetical protein
MLEALSAPHNRTVTFVLLAVCCASAIAAILVGISDNPPGIILAFAAATAFILAFVHPWRTAKQFSLFLLASILGLVVFGILHNVLEGTASTMEGMNTIRIFLQGLGVVTFLIAVLICPPAILIGAVGSIVMFIRNRLRPTKDDSIVN